MARIRIAFWLIMLLLTGCNLNQGAESTALPPSPSPTIATALSCDDLVTVALNKANQVCTTLGRNQACYGNNLIDAELQPNATVSFTKAGDIVGVDLIRKLTTAPLDTSKQVWGIAILKIQANLADTVPGQNVTFLLFGNAVLDNITPKMQAVVLRTGVGGTTSCSNAPKSALLLQSPEGSQATMTINGASISLGSTAYLTAEQNSELTVATIEGSAVVSSANITRVVQPGAQVHLPLGGGDGLQVSGPPSQPEPFDVQAVGQAPLPLLERQVQVPPPIAPVVPTNTSVPVVPTACVVRADWNFSYTIQTGDTLFNVAQSFGLSVNELQQGNCIANANQIQVGQVIRVPRQLATAVPQPTAQPTNTIAPTPINPNLRADSTQLQQGECTTIRWDATNVSQVLFQGQPVTVTSQQVCPRVDTTYTLLLTYQDGKQVPYSVRILVALPQATTDTTAPQ
ncbi:MAG: LysM peptidoglycan-binding domain-containing protein [Anaerolineaceae bacterium]|nr:LysM peptidoglycan-binding domain-containing protein [Anaerolineaceae bacterium]